jgi:hypothetical protein
MHLRNVLSFCRGRASSLVVALLLALLLAPLLAPLMVSAQEQPAANESGAAGDDRLRVFLDCPTGGCDRNFFITEMPYAIWTQDRLDADVHLLITRIGTGSGGSEYALQFIAQRRLGEGADTLLTAVPPNTSDDMRRRALSRMIHIGLVGRAARFRGRGRFADRMVVRYEGPERSEDAAGSAQADRWNLWVYRVNLRGNGSAESRSSDYEVSGGFTARRITEQWKLDFNVDNEYNASRFELSDGSTRRFILRSGNTSARVVRSLSDHWSVGSRVRAGLSEFRNQDAFASVDLSAEYNFFPWREATSRQLIALLDLGSRYYDYREITLYERTSEHRPVMRAILAGESRQPWGTVDGSLQYTQFLHDRERFNLSFNGRTNLRLSRGLSLELRGSAAKVQDQLYLPRGDATDDEVLTRQRALATAFRLNGSVGISFTFGSIYNTIVNPRLDELGG